MFVFRLNPCFNFASPTQPGGGGLAKAAAGAEILREQRGNWAMK
jgi:hypothetical protein